MNGNAPNRSATGSQIDRPRKSNPNLWNASFEFIAISTMINAASPATSTANAPVNALNSGSPILGRDVFESEDSVAKPGPGDRVEPGVFPAILDAIARDYLVSSFLTACPER